MAHRDRELFHALDCRKHQASAARPTGRTPGPHSRPLRLIGAAWAAILVSDVIGYSRLAGADEDRILVRLWTLRGDLIDPTIAVHHGRIVKRTGDGSIIKFRSVVTR